MFNILNKDFLERNLAYCILMLCFTYLTKSNNAFEFIGLLLLGALIIAQVLNAEVSKLQKLLILICTLLTLIFRTEVLFILLAVLKFHIFDSKNKTSTYFLSTLIGYYAINQIVGNLGLFGVPYLAFFSIVFWGLPCLIITLILFKFINNNLKIAAVLLLISSLFYLYLNTSKSLYPNQKIAVVISKESPVKISAFPPLQVDFILEEELIKNQKIVSNYRTLIFPLPLLNTIHEEWVRKIQDFKGQLFIFGEHENLNKFIDKNNSDFNNDYYQRSIPWHTQSPYFLKLLRNISNDYKFLSSNIGCTLKTDYISTPLYWDYDSFGLPLILAQFKTDSKRNLSYYVFGDTDPIVSFLYPFNSSLLLKLIGITTIHEWIIIIIQVFLSLILLANLSFFISPIFVIIISLLYFYLPLSETKNHLYDFHISTTSKWYSPHYEGHFSSIVKNLDNKNVLIDNYPNLDYAKSKCHIVIVCPGTNLKLKGKLAKDKTTLIIVMPGGSVVYEKNVIRVIDTPIISKEIDLNNKKIIISDFRQIYFNNSATDFFIDKDSSILILGSNSPQKIEGLNEFIQ